MTTGEFGEKTFTTFEVARLCGVFHTTVINWVNKGKLDARVTPGGHRRIPLTALLPFMKKYQMPIPAEIEKTHKQILILDGERTATRLEKGLNKHKARYEVQVARNPVDALVIIGKHPPHLLVVDILMPVMDGFQVCQILKSNPVTRNMKIIAVCDKKLSGSQQEFVEKNCDSLMQRPFELQEIVGTLDRLLV